MGVAEIEQFCGLAGRKMAAYFLKKHILPFF